MVLEGIILPLILCTLFLLGENTEEGLLTPLALSISLLHFQAHCHSEGASRPEIVTQCCNGDLLASTASDFSLWFNQFSLSLFLSFFFFSFVSPCFLSFLSYLPLSLLFLKCESRAERMKS